MRYLGWPVGVYSAGNYISRTISPTSYDVQLPAIRKRMGGNCRVDCQYQLGGYTAGPYSSSFLKVARPSALPLLDALNAALPLGFPGCSLAILRFHLPSDWGQTPLLAADRHSVRMSRTLAKPRLDLPGPSYQPRWGLSWH